MLDSYTSSVLAEGNSGTTGLKTCTPASRMWLDGWLKDHDEHTAVTQLMFEVRSGTAEHY